MDASFAHWGFLPAQGPATQFPDGSEFAPLDTIGRDLPSMLEDQGFRRYARNLKLPLWPDRTVQPEDLPLLRLYYVRVGFLASAYVNQVGQERATMLPHNLSVPLVRAARLLHRPPILSYDGYALYNWKRFDPKGPIALGNIDTIQNFVHLYDEHWFILVHVEIESLAAGMLAAIAQIQQALPSQDSMHINHALADVGRSIWRQVEVLRRIPEKMDPALYFRTFRPYIRFFENVVYEGVEIAPMNHRGETGAQSSIVPALVALMKISHRPSELTNHLADMRNFMPVEHRALLGEIEALPDLRPLADKQTFNDILEGLATFREVHLSWAQQYINDHVADPRGTGGTPYMKWLGQLIEETRGHKIA